MPYGSNMESALKTLAALHKLVVANGLDSDEAADVIKSHRNQITKALIHCNARPFIVAPSQLDTTQPEQFGYGTDTHAAKIKAFLQKCKEDHGRPYSFPTKKKDLGHNLSAFINLTPGILGGQDVLYHNKDPVRKYSIIPEISRRGTRRCCFVKSNGMRCTAYGPIPVCSYHINLVKAVPYMNDRFLSAIQNENLRTAYKKHLADPNRHGVEAEVALMRTMLDALLHRVDITMDLQNLPMETIGAITAMCSKITSTVGEMVQMETKMQMRLNIEQVTMLMLRVAEEIITIVKPTQEQCALIAASIENLPLKRVTAESIADTKSYGHDQPIHTTAATSQTKYLEDGTVVPMAFTQQEVQVEREWVKEKFAASTAAYKAKLQNLSNGTV